MLLSIQLTFKTESIAKLYGLFLISASPQILSRLKLETRGEHNLVEQALDLMNSSLSTVGYCLHLQKFYGFYAPLESALIESLDLGHADVAIRKRLEKATYLSRDLAYLNIIAARLPLCTQLPPLRTQAEVLGCLYVIEGATLGGQLITKHIQRTLDIQPESGGSFFQGYGDDTALMWRGLRQLLIEGASDNAAENAIVTSAIATFASLRQWYQSGK